MAVLVERRCRHGGMRLHYVRIHVLLRLHANLLHAMSGLALFYARVLWESMSRAREGGMRGDWCICRGRY